MQVSTSVQTSVYTMQLKLDADVNRHLNGCATLRCFFFSFSFAPSQCSAWPCPWRKQCLPLARIQAFSSTFSSNWHRMGHTGTKRPDWLLSNHPPSWPHKRTQNDAFRELSANRLLFEHYWWGKKCHDMGGKHKKKKQACFGTLLAEQWLDHILRGCRGTSNRRLRF